MYWIAFKDGQFELNSWPNQKIFYLYIFSTIPLLILYGLRFFISCKLILKSYRNTRNVTLLKHLFFYSAILYAINFYIDKNYFEVGFETLNIIGFFFNTIWFFYFSYSRRVKYVFTNPDKETWNYDAFLKFKKDSDI